MVRSSGATKRSPTCRTDPPISTGPYETFNSLVFRLAAGGVEMTVAEVAAAVAEVKGLIAATASVFTTRDSVNLFQPQTCRV